MELCQSSGEFGITSVLRWSQVSPRVESCHSSDRVMSVFGWSQVSPRVESHQPSCESYQPLRDMTRKRRSLAGTILGKCAAV